MSIYIKDSAGNRQKFAGVGLPGPPGADGKSAYQYAVDGGFTETEAEFAALMGVHSNQNLLDNWCFLDPINQRGQETYTAYGYTIDRWMISGAVDKLSVSDSGVFLKSNGANSIYFHQYLERMDLSAVYTFSILSDGKLYSVSGVPERNLVVATPFGRIDFGPKYNDSTILQVTVTVSAELTIQAAKLELGPVQTLAHQDADGSWVLNDPPPDKALELLKCQRYFQRRDVKTQILALPGTNIYSIPVNFNVPMRANPTVTLAPLEIRISGVKAIDLSSGVVNASWQGAADDVAMLVSGINLSEALGRTTSISYAASADL